MSIYDSVKGFAGIVTGAIPEEYKMRIMKNAQKGKVGFSQYKRRVYDWQRLSGPDEANIQMYLIENEIIAKEPTREDKLMVSFITNNVANYGVLDNLIRGAARANNGRITLAALEKVNKRIQNINPL